MHFGANHLRMALNNRVNNLIHFMARQFFLIASFRHIFSLLLSLAQPRLSKTFFRPTHHLHFYPKVDLHNEGTSQTYEEFHSEG
jgi:hypothetical protein